MKSTKEYSNNPNYPKTLVSVVISLTLLAGSVTFASWVLLSYPIGTAVRSYFYTVGDVGDSDTLVTWQDVTPIDSSNNDNTTSLAKEFSNSNMPQNNGTVGQPKTSSDRKADHDNGLNQSTPLGAESDTEGNKTEIASDSNRSTNGDRKVNRSGPPGNATVTESDSHSSKKENAMKTGVKPMGHEEVKQSKPSEANTECDLYHGHWVYDPSGPLYTNSSCPIITQTQNCQSNGRPDKEYENWRWKPTQCDLRRFDGKRFLELMSRKTLAFVGDSVARNQYESLLCMLWQVEVPVNRGNRQMQRWFFRSKSVMIVRVWSSWLVHTSSEPFSYAPRGIAKVFLDVPDETFMNHIASFDVVVLSSGHWFAKQSAYVLNNEIVGTQLWYPREPHDLQLNSVNAFGISVETVLTALATHPNYKGLTIVRSYSPDHYEGGEWNTGGSCTGKTEPLPPGKLVENGFINVMHEKQVMGFKRAMENTGNSTKLKLMDITKVFLYRHDGHPGPYRSPDPNKQTQRGPDGRPPPQDCLHWCMPGAVDTWNELLMEVIRREFERSNISTS